MLLSRISPDLVRERAKRARANTGLRRWVGEPGVDEWHGTFPSEDAASAWAAIDRLAHDLVAAGTCSNIEQARGKALTDLVTGNATIDVQIILTVPADTQPAPEGQPGTAATDLPAPDPATPGVDSQAPVTAAVVGSTDTSAAPRDSEPAEACPDESPLEAKELGDDHMADGPSQERGTSVAEGHVLSTPAERTEELAAASAEPERTSAIAIQGPGAPAECIDDMADVDGAPPSTPATVVDIPAHAPPAHHPAATGTDGSLTPSWPPHPTPSTNTEANDEDLVEVQGSRPSEPLLVRRGWLRDHLGKQPPQSRGSRKKKGEPPRSVPCDPRTGARLDPRDDLATNAYRPGAELTALVRARDGRCRFPGCCVAARFCDLDHVRPWPTGPTTATNLLTLCRRHHRIKQRPGWRLHLAPDGTATWTDPTGRARTTAPLNALHTLVLRADAADAGLRVTSADSAGAALVAEPADPGQAQFPVIPGPESLVTTATPTERPLAEPVTGSVWSALEHHLAFSLEHHVHPVDVALRTHSTHRRCTSAADVRAGHARTKARAQWPDEPPF